MKISKSTLTETIYAGGGVRVSIKGTCINVTILAGFGETTFPVTREQATALVEAFTEILTEAS